MCSIYNYLTALLGSCLTFVICNQHVFKGNQLGCTFVPVVSRASVKLLQAAVSN